ncbi:MAG: hypothetical protein RL539_610 [Pseudomonadota bacterium]|jgi:NADPH2:quinone reductase
MSLMHRQHPDQALWCHQLSDDLSGVGLAAVKVGEPGPGEVRLRVRAGALNFPDLLMTRGLYQYKPTVPFVLGLEGCGIVEAIGEGVNRLMLGDRVAFSCRQGAFATTVVLPAEVLSLVPPGLDDAQAAAYSVTALTAWVSLVRRGNLLAGETALIHGANGGVGIAAVQLAKYLGAHVIATASSEAKLALARGAGADHCLVLEAAWHEKVKDITQGRGVDLCMDPVGGDVFDGSIRAMAWGGRVLVVGFASGRFPKLSVNHALIKGLSILGVRAGESGRRDPSAGREDRAKIRQLLSQGVMLPPIGARFSLSDGVRALQAMAERQVVGKLCLEMT